MPVCCINLHFFKRLSTSFSVPFKWNILRWLSIYKGFVQRIRAFTHRQPLLWVADNIESSCEILLYIHIDCFLLKGMHLQESHCNVLYVTFPQTNLQLFPMWALLCCLTKFKQNMSVQNNAEHPALFISVAHSKYVSSAHTIHFYYAFHVQACSEKIAGAIRLVEKLKYWNI